MIPTERIEKMRRLMIAETEVMYEDRLEDEFKSMFSDGAEELLEI